MKVTFGDGFKGMSGHRDDSVFYTHKVTKACIVRSKPQYEPNARTERLKLVMANLRQLNPSAAYKKDFTDYLDDYNALKENRGNQLISWSNLYLKILYKLAKVNPEVDLLTLTREQIISNNLPCISLKAAIEAGLLPEVAAYARFDNQI
jgi:hypothetical protein